MSSAVYFKFKASLKQYTIPFEGSSISVKDLKNAIKLQCGLKSSDFELEILDKQGKEYVKDDDLIPKFSDLVVRRLPKASDPPKKKIHNPEDMTRRDPYKSMNSIPKINLLSSSMNLARANMPDDEKIDIIAKRVSDEYSEKNYQVKSKPYGVPPPSYVCNKCHQSGHWIHECPGLRDKDGRLLDFKSVKRPTGIPQDFLLEVEPGTPGAYLTKEGKYMVPIKDAEAYALGKKEKRPFSEEENPPLIVKHEELPKKLQCPLCKKLLSNATSTPCCNTVYCSQCIRDYLYDPEVNGNRKCPNCQKTIENYSELKENKIVHQIIACWKHGYLQTDIIEKCITTPTEVPNIKTELNKDTSNSPVVKNEPALSTEATEEDSSINSTPEDKVFINNRRLLKPKTEPELKKSASSVSLDTHNENDITKSTTITQTTTTITTTSIPTATLTSITKPIDMKKELINKITKPIDENDLIFGRVEDDRRNNRYRLQASQTNRIIEPIKDSNNNSNSKIEILPKRHHDLMPRNYKYDKPLFNTKLEPTLLPTNTAALLNPTELAKTLQVVSNILQHSSDATGTATTAVQPQVQPQVQQPIVNNSIDPTNWSLLANLPILNASVGAGAALNNPNVNLTNNTNFPNNSISNAQNWLDCNSLALLNKDKHIMSEEEFYNIQRKLRKAKGKRLSSSRSPSGSQSPKRYRRDYNSPFIRNFNDNRRPKRSRSREYYQKFRERNNYHENRFTHSPVISHSSQPPFYDRSSHSHYRDRNQKYEIEQKYRDPHQKYRDPNQKYRDPDQKYRDPDQKYRDPDQKYRDRSHRDRDRDRDRHHRRHRNKHETDIKYEPQLQPHHRSSSINAINNLQNSIPLQFTTNNDFSDIDGKKMQDSINTFLKYLSAGQVKTEPINSEIMTQTNRSTGSSSASSTKPQNKKPVNESNSSASSGSKTPPRKIKRVRSPVIKSEYVDYKNDEEEASMDEERLESHSSCEKKVKKSKKKHKYTEEELALKKKHKKKKHKHKKTKKVKKEKKSS